MTATVRPVKRRKTTFMDRLFLPAIIKGMGITFGRMFKKKITMQFPEERWTVRERYRGMPVLVTDDEGRPKCVGCSMCAQLCAADAIRDNEPAKAAVRAILLDPLAALSRSCIEGEK